MFKKQATFKPSAAIRNSERKGLVVEVKHHFASAFDDKSDEEIKEILDLILPSAGIESAAFVTSKGQRGILYNHTGEAIFIKYEDQLVPTLQTLWKYPSLVSTALTGSQVLANLQAGSDLMVKGMFEYSVTVRRNDIVGILLNDRPHIVAVGIAALDFKDVDRDIGGKGILLVSCLGDTITPMTSYPADNHGTQQDLPVTDVTEGVSVIDVSDTGAQEQSPRDHDESSLTTDEIDKTFSQALLYGLHALSKQDRQVSLPMASSTMIDVHVLPYLPSPDPNLVLKKTSWKKATKFLSKQRVLKCKETKGQLNITGIDWTSTDLTSFRPYSLPTASREAHEGQAAAETQASENTSLTIEEFYSLPSKYAPLLTTLKKEYYTKEELREVLNSYYTSQSLVSQTTRKMIVLDPQLYHLLVPESSSSKKELSRDVLLRSLVKGSTLHHRINGGKMKKGGVPDLHIVMESRQGRKAVTRLVHLEKFFATEQVERIVDELKHKCAVSVSIGEVKGTKPGSSVELTVQGKKAPEAVEVLEKWGVQKSMIKVEDKTK